MTRKLFHSPEFAFYFFSFNKKQFTIYNEHSSNLNYKYGGK